MDPIFTPPVVIEEALRVLLGAGATQAEINAAYTSILGAISRADAYKLTVSQIDKLIYEGGLFTDKVVKTIKAAKDLSSLTRAGGVWSGGASATRMLGAGVRSAVRKRAGSAIAAAVIGGGLLIGLIFAVWTAYDIYSLSSGDDAGAPCPSPIPTAARKCPWTPEGYSVQPCTQGFCWDGGPQGALACKQEQSVPNSGRTYTTDLVCNEGYTATRDRCTGVILGCVKQ